MNEIHEAESPIETISVPAAPHAPDPERHARKCAVCHHPNREEIEQDFLNWRDPFYIAREWKVSSYHSIERHARATGLLERRRQDFRIVLDHILENGPDKTVSPDSLIRAIRAHHCLAPDGRWVEPQAPPREIIHTFRELRSPAPEGDPYAPARIATPRLPGDLPGDPPEQVH